MKIISPESSKPKLVKVSSVADYTVVRWDNRLWFKSRSFHPITDHNLGWAVAMSGAPGWLSGETFVEVVDTELVVKS